MSDVKPVAWERFDELGVEYDSYVGLVEEGDYVKYDDALATVTALQAEVEALRTTDLQVYEQNTSLDLRCAELEKENEALRKDAERYRWLRDQHEGLVLNGNDADGIMLAASVRALAFTVFMPDKWEHESLVPVPIGDLDEAVDAAIAKEKQQESLK